MIGEPNPLFFPVVQTAQGRLRGLAVSGVSMFKGIRYGASTAGANRYRPPQPPPEWSGIEDRTAYGNLAPQHPSSRTRRYSDLILYDIQPGGMGEDCLVLNLWTSSLDAGAKLPVMVHLHGGGWYGGTGNSPQFDGQMVAETGEALFISINHRIGSFGFLDLEAFGDPRFAGSGSNGMADVVAALDWIRENIAAFGGDPDRVLVFGQSGGGAKTSTLLAMPSAQGLFHRAGIMSGSALRLGNPDETTAMAERFLALLGIAPDALERLQELPFQTLLSAQIELEMEDRRKGEAPRAFLPVVREGARIPLHPLEAAQAGKVRVPVIIGTVLDERSYRRVDFDMSEAELHAQFAAQMGPQSEDTLQLYRAEDAGAAPYLMAARLDTDLTFRLAAWIMSDALAQAGTPTWAYLWAKPSRAFGGQFGATHGVDLGPSLGDIRLGLNGPAQDWAQSAAVMSALWRGFAARGAPLHDTVPWPAFTAAQRQTLVVGADGSFGVQSDPRGAIRRAVMAHKGVSPA